MASLNNQRDSSTSAQEQRERRLERRQEREKEPAVPQKQRSKERPGWQEDEPVTELGKQFRQKNRGKHIYNVDVKG